MTKTLTLVAPAKLNLFLHITERQPDGYHKLQTVFQLLDFGDQLHFTEASAGEINVSVTDEFDSGPSATKQKFAKAVAAMPLEENLVYRATKLLLDCANFDVSDRPGVSIELHKRLPVGGGLGGGSSDAATTLVGLNQFWQLGFSIDKLCQLGVNLGADVPVFVRGRSAWAEGIGDQLTALELPPQWYVIVRPNCEVSTTAIFQHPELTRNTLPITIRAFFSGDTLGKGTANNCQAVTELLFPEVAKARNWLTQYGPARMTGTGACVFACFESRDECRKVLADMPEPWFGFAAKGVNVSPLYDNI